MTDVGPEATSPARRIADFTCPLGLAILWSQPPRAAPGPPDGRGPALSTRGSGRDGRSTCRPARESRHRAFAHAARSRSPARPALTYRVGLFEQLDQARVVALEMAAQPRQLGGDRVELL